VTRLITGYGRDMWCRRKEEESKSVSIVNAHLRMTDHTSPKAPIPTGCKSTYRVVTSKTYTRWVSAASSPILRKGGEGGQGCHQTDTKTYRSKDRKLDEVRHRDLECASGEESRQRSI